MARKRTVKRPHLASRIKSLIRVPIVNQATDYTCGVAALLSVLYYWDKDEEIYESELAVELDADPEDGVVSAAIVRFAASHGFKAPRKVGLTLEELEGFLRAGKPVIVLFQAWPDSAKPGWEAGWDDGHFAVAIGYDAHNIYFMDPSTLGNYTYLPKEEFLKRWHDWDGDEQVHHLGVPVWRGRPSFDQRIVVRMG